MMFLTISLLAAFGQAAQPGSTGSHPAAWESTVDELAAPGAVAMMADGRVLVTEPHAHRIAVLNSNGSRETTWGMPGTSPGTWHRPSGIDTDDQGTIVVADTGNHRIQILDERGTVVDVLDADPLSGTSFRSPRDVAMSSQWLAVADTGNDRVCAFNRNAATGWCIDPSVSLKAPEGVDVDDDGSLFVADTGNHRVLVFNPDGSLRSEWGGWGRFPGLFAEPCGVEVRGDLVYVADRLNHRIQVFTPDGKPVTWWGMHAVVPRQGEGNIHYPSDVAISSSGDRSVVSEPFERRIQFFQPGPPSRPARSNTRAPRGLQSHFGAQVEAGGRGLVTWEPEVRSLATFVTDREVPIHVSTFGTPGDGPGRIGDIADLSWNARTGVLTIVDSGNGTVQRWRITLPPADALRFDPNAAVLLDSTPLPRIDSNRPLRPGTIAGDDSGSLHVIDETLDRVITLDFDGQRLVERDRAAPWPADLDPVAIAANETMLAVADGRTGRIHLFDTEGHPQQIIGPAPGVAHPWPGGIAILDDGSIAVSDTAADRIDHYAATGDHLSTLSSSGGDHGQVWMPGEITQDAMGRIVVLDHGNHRMQGFQPGTGWVLTFGLGRAMTPERLKRSAPP